MGITTKTNIAYQLGDNIGYGIGVEFNFNLAFLNNAFDFTIEPTFVYREINWTENTLDIKGFSTDYTIKYQSIQLPFGAKYKMALNQKTDLFLNLTPVHDFSTGSTYSSERFDGSTNDFLVLNLTASAGFGIGIKTAYDLTAELRYQNYALGGSVFASDVAMMESLNFIVGYKIF